MTEAGLSVERIEALVKAARSKGLALLELEVDSASLGVRFERAGGGEVKPGATTPTFMRPPADISEPIRSPGVGRFLRRHPLGGPALPEPDAAVEVGALLGFIDSAGVLLPVRAPRAGRLGPPLLPDGTAVGFGAPLFKMP